MVSRVYRLYLSMCVCVYLSMCVCVYLSMCVCVYLSMTIISIYLCASIYVFVHWQVHASFGERGHHIISLVMHSVICNITQMSKNRVMCIFYYCGWLAYLPSIMVRRMFLDNMFETRQSFLSLVHSGGCCWFQQEWLQCCWNLASIYSLDRNCFGSCHAVYVSGRTCHQELWRQAQDFW